MDQAISRQNGRAHVTGLDEPRPVVNLVGERIALGPLSRELLPTYRRWLNDFSLLALLDRRFRPLTADWIETWFARHDRGDPSSMVFTIWERGSWLPIGNAALQDLDLRNRSAELGLFIGEPGHRRQGYGTEATRLVLDFGFNVLGLRSIMLRVFEYNLAARRCYEKAGFREFGRRAQSQFMDGRFWDVIYMECLSGSRVDTLVDTQWPTG
ncbi:MAG: GNAT family N-acetyltransferase [Thermomicrobiales bacterium]